MEARTWGKYDRYGEWQRGSIIKRVRINDRAEGSEGRDMTAILEELKRAVDSWIDTKARQSGGMADRFMAWHDWNAHPRPHPRNFDRYPYRFVWHNGRWYRSGSAEYQRVLRIPQRSVLLKWKNGKEEVVSHKDLGMRRPVPCFECGVITEASNWFWYKPDSGVCLCLDCADDQHTYTVINYPDWR